MCIPDISGVAPGYGRKVAHYVAEILSVVGGEGYFDRLLDSNVTMEINPYKYDLKTHTIHSLEVDLLEYYGDIMGVKVFE